MEFMRYWGTLGAVALGAAALAWIPVSWFLLGRPAGIFPMVATGAILALAILEAFALRRGQHRQGARAGIVGARQQPVPAQPSIWENLQEMIQEHPEGFGAAVWAAIAAGFLIASRLTLSRTLFEGGMIAVEVAALFLAVEIAGRHTVREYPDRWWLAISAVVFLHCLAFRHWWMALVFGISAIAALITVRRTWGEIGEATLTGANYAVGRAGDGIQWLLGAILEILCFQHGPGWALLFWSFLSGTAAGWLGEHPKRFLLDVGDMSLRRGDAAFWLGAVSIACGIALIVLWMKKGQRLWVKIRRLGRAERRQR